MSRTWLQQGERVWGVAGRAVWVRVIWGRLLGVGVSCSLGIRGCGARTWVGWLWLARVFVPFTHGPSSCCLCVSSDLILPVNQLAWRSTLGSECVLRCFWTLTRLACVRPWWGTQSLAWRSGARPSRPVGLSAAGTGSRPCIYSATSMERGIRTVDASPCKRSVMLWLWGLVMISEPGHRT